MSFIKRILAVIRPERKPVGILKPETSWAFDSAGGLVTNLEVLEKNVVRVEFDNWTAFYLEDLRGLKEQLEVGVEKWITKGHFKTPTGFESLDWVYDVDPRLAIEAEKHRPAG